MVGHHVIGLSGSGSRRSRFRSGGPSAAWLLSPLAAGGPLGGSFPGRQMLLERLDYLVDELAVRGGVPAEPVARVAAEAVATEHRRLMRPSASTTAPGLLLGAPLAALRALEVERGQVAAVERPRDHVREYLPVFGREDGDKGQDGGREELHNGEDISVALRWRGAGGR